MKRSDKRILTTHTGSLVRPSELKGLVRPSEDGPGRAESIEHYLETVRRATYETVRKQAAAGLDIISDGEFGKSSWSNYILTRVTGFETRPNQLRPVEWLGRDLQRFGDVIAREMPNVLTGRPVDACGSHRIPRPCSHRTGDRQLSGSPERNAGCRSFPYCVAPASTAYDGVNEYYPSESEYVFASRTLCAKNIMPSTVRFSLQVDDAVLANMYDEPRTIEPAALSRMGGIAGGGPESRTAGIPEDRVRYHVCFGSWHVPHISDAPLEEIVDLILRVRAGAYSIEAANPRHEHEWRVWANNRLPPGKILIPGVVTHHTIVVEHPRLVADRIIRFAKLVGRENVIAGTDCGFAQPDVIERVPEPVMWANSEALVEGAALASKELY